MKEVGFEKLRKEVGFARWQMHLACEAGIIERSPKGGFEPAEATRIRRRKKTIAKLIRLEERINSKRAAEELEISVVVFKEMAAAGMITEAEIIPWRYGPVRLYRRGDVLALRRRLPAFHRKRQERIRKNRMRGAKDRSSGPNLQKIEREQRDSKTLNNYMEHLESTDDASLALCAFWLMLVDEHRNVNQRKLERLTRQQSKDACQTTLVQLSAARRNALHLLVAHGHALLSLDVWMAKETTITSVNIAVGSNTFQTVCNYSMLNMADWEVHPSCLPSENISPHYKQHYSVPKIAPEWSQQLTTKSVHHPGGTYINRQIMGRLLRAAPAPMAIDALQAYTEEFIQDQQEPSPPDTDWFPF